jgi:hypothetical protein
VKALPYSIYKVVQGLCFPRKAKILCLGSWNTDDWESSQTVVNELTVDTDIVIMPCGHEDTEKYLKRMKHIDYRYHLVFYSFDKESLEMALGDLEKQRIIESMNAYIGILLHKFGQKSFLSNKIIENSPINIDDPAFFIPGFISEKWSQKGNNIYFQAPEVQIQFIVPNNFSLKRTSLDLLWAIEYVLLSPWHDKYLSEWVPMRRPGRFPGLSFSGGVDSTAAMCLMPENSLLFYLERDFDSMIQHENAHRFISHLETIDKEVVVIKSNHEIIRTFYSKNPGFSTDYACMAHLILLADHFDLDAAATGMPLENSYFFHGSRIRDFSQSSFWKRYSPIFSYLGIPLYQPVAGCSEILNNTIVNTLGYAKMATSCLRSKEAGKTCNECWKCFRKNIFNGLDWKMSPEISTFLAKRPLKQGMATLYALQLIHKSNENLPEEVADMHPLMDKDFSFLNQYWNPSLALLPPKYRLFTEEKLLKLTSKMEVDLYKCCEGIEDILRGNNS